MAYNTIAGFPSQQLPSNKKNKEWRMKCVDAGDGYSPYNNTLARMTVDAMQVNYDLMHGKIHMDELKLLVNPFNIDASFIPDDIQHYPIINSKVEVLKGEESKRLFDFRAVVTNPNAISEMEEEKNRQVNEKLQQLIMETSMSEEDYQKELEKLDYYFQYEYQDKREVRANLVLNHYSKELEFNQMFNRGFDDVIPVSEEIYQCDIVGGEPCVWKLNPREVTIVSDGMSNRIEDAPMIIIEQYWSREKIIDVFWDSLTKKDRDNLENYWKNGDDDNWNTHMDITPFYNVVPPEGWTAGDMVDLFDETGTFKKSPYDAQGNIRVVRVYWKSRKKIKKVKSYDPETGEEVINFRTEKYVIDPDKGEEEKTYWVNEAWEGTKIGKDIYVNMRPRPIQYNRLSSPSRCHFGIIGQIYTNNGDKPLSLVDIMKPYAYLYDVVHDRLNKTLARNHGKLIRLDFAKTPDWPVDEWLYYINTHGVLVEDSFKEGNKGTATGKLAGALNNASTGVVDGSLSQEITQYINYLEWIKTSMGELAGISKQREGQIANRETVGGVERATLQSSHSTEWLFFPHESVKKRVLECFLETAKIAFKGRHDIKFNYILNDGSTKLVELDGDEFAECDYGIVVDNSNGAQELNQKLDMLAQAGLQNGMSFSTIMKLYTTTSLSEKQRMVEQDEKKRLEQAQQQQQQEYQLQQQQMQLNAQMAQQKMELEYRMHQEKLQNNILVAQINGEAENIRMALMNHDNDEANTLEREKIAEQARQFDSQLKENAKQFESKLAFDKQKLKADTAVKEKQIAKSNKSTTKK